MRIWPLAAALVLASCRAPVPGTGRTPPESAPFEEGAAAAGIAFRQRTGKGASLNLVQTSAGGCALLDYDGDGWLDAFLVQGRHIPGPMGGNRLYRNHGDGTFSDATAAAGVRGRGYGMGCAVGDFDGDSRPDLFVANQGACELYRNRGDGTFADVSSRLGPTARGCCVGGVLADLDADGWSDLYVVRYVQWPRSPVPCAQGGVPVPCGPLLYTAQPGAFLHNDRGQRFVDRTQPSGLVNTGRGMGAAVADPWAIGRPSLFVTNDSTANAFFRPTGANGSFEDAALDAGIAYGSLGSAEGNMGCDFGDYDGDGRLDLVVGVMQDRATLLFRNAGDGMFIQDLDQRSLTGASTAVVTFTAGFLDYDNDGDLDLFQTNGHVADRVAEVDPRLSYRQPRQLFENDGRGILSDVTSRLGPGFATPAVGRGAAFGDLDNDGDVDILVNNLDEGPALLWNRAERLRRHWLRVRLTGRAPRTRMDGALVRLTVGDRVLVRHVHSAQGYASAGDPRVHFGLGAVDAVRKLEVLWPGGKWASYPVAGVDREVLVSEG